MSKTTTVLGTALMIPVAATAIGLGSTLIPRFEIRRVVDTSAMLDVSVTISTISHVTTDPVGDSVWQAGSGSGFLVSRQGCELWTARHVVNEAAVIEVFPRGWTGTRGIPAQVVNSTPRPDFAILRMEHCDEVAVARLGQSDALAAGDETYAVGNPLGRNPDSISRGIISHTQRYLHGKTAFLQTDAAINPGNSGGPLFNQAGEVVGINTAIASTSGSNIGVGYAVPIDRARLAAKALHQGPPRWGTAGIDESIGTLSRDEARVFNLPNAHGAVIVTSTPSDGPAFGVLQARDVIYRIGGKAVYDASTALRMIADHEPDTALEFEFVRGGTHQSAVVRLTNGWTKPERKLADDYDGLLGMTIEMWADENDNPLLGARRFDFPVITKIHSLGPAHRAHISSSQRNVAIHGPAMVPYQLDVKTITGLVYEGEYYAVRDVESLSSFALRAQSTGQSLLLEIEYWGRRDKKAIRDSLEHLDTAFFRVQPATSQAGRGGSAMSEEQMADSSPAVDEQEGLTDQTLVLAESPVPGT